MKISKEAARKMLLKLTDGEKLTNPLAQSTNVPTNHFRESSAIQFH